MSERKERTRALFKKGQKCLTPRFEVDYGGEDRIYFEQGEVMRAEKRVLDDNGEESMYFYLIKFSGSKKATEVWMEEPDLFKYDVDLLHDVSTEATLEAKRRAWRIYKEKKEQMRMIDVPEHLRLRVPPRMKKELYDEYVSVVESGQILPLPRAPTVSDIVKNWNQKVVEEVESMSDETREAVAIVVKNLLEYFNLGLRQFLLYRSEVPLYDKVIVEGKKEPADVYGAEHLVRLLVKLPELVCVRMMALPENAKYIVMAEDVIQDLMSYLSQPEQLETLFAPSQEYKQCYEVMSHIAT